MEMSRVAKHLEKSYRPGGFKGHTSGLDSNALMVEYPYRQATATTTQESVPGPNNLTSRTRTATRRA